jgi:isoquinoline 1-oxidoreductase beta subunit
VTHVIELRSGVAVVAKNFWAAKTGRDALKVEWELGPQAHALDRGAGEEFRETRQDAGKVATKAATRGDQGRGKTLVAGYEVPFLAHAAWSRSTAPWSCRATAPRSGWARSSRPSTAARRRRRSASSPRA